MSSLDERVVQYLQDRGVRKDDLLILAVSGGMDSMSLMHILHRNKYNIEVVHINYHLRAEASIQDAKLVEKRCIENNIPFRIYENSLKELRSGIQEKARKIRYEIFDTLLKERNAEYIVVAHHRDDQLETLVFNLFRGTGISGLSNMLLDDGRILRPLIKISKEEIESYAKENMVLFREDASNSKNDYSRNLIRNEILPHFKSLFPDYRQRLQKTASLIAAQESLYKDLIKSSVESCLIRNSYYREYNIGQLRHQDQVSLILYEYFKRYGFTFQQFDDLLRSATSETKRILATDHSIYLKKDSLYFIENRHLKPPQIVTLNDFTDNIIWGPYSIKLQLLSYANYTELKAFSSATLFLDYDRICFPINIRPYSEGDRIESMKKGSKKISDVFIDHKYELFKRSIHPIFYSENQAICIPELTINYNLRPNKQTVKVLSISMNPDNLCF